MGRVFLSQAPEQFPSRRPRRALAITSATFVAYIASVSIDPGLLCAVAALGSECPTLPSQRHNGRLVAYRVSCDTGEPQATQRAASSPESLLIEAKERLNPIAASAKVSERVKRIHKVNVEVADWLVVMANRGQTCSRSRSHRSRNAGRWKMPMPRVCGSWQEGRWEMLARTWGTSSSWGLARQLTAHKRILDAPWKKIIASTEEIAKSHSMFADRINTDVELPLRNFWVENREMAGFPTIQGNLSSMAKELEDAQSKCDKLSQKGGKASAQKVDAAAARLQTASSQWNSQAPFILETLQSVDESRLNQLRDVLTQYETHEMDNLIRCQQISESALHVLVEVDTSIEIVQWAQAVVAGRPVLDRRSAARQSSSIAEGSPGGNAHSQPPAAPASAHADNQSEHSGKQEHGKAKQLR